MPARDAYPLADCGQQAALLRLGQVLRGQRLRPAQHDKVIPGEVVFQPEGVLYVLDLEAKPGQQFAGPGRDLVRLMTFRQSDASLVELTMPDDAPLVGQRIGDIDWPADTALVAILRDGRVIVPAKDDPLETGDELLFVTSEDVEDDLATLLSGGHHHQV